MIVSQLQLRDVLYKLCIVVYQTNGKLEKESSISFLAALQKYAERISSSDLKDRQQSIQHIFVRLQYYED